jgi:hypothetical protein
MIREQAMVVLLMLLNCGGPTEEKRNDREATFGAEYITELSVKINFEDADG